MPRRFFIHTIGCQMNVLDSELVAAELTRAGYEQVDSVRRADIVLFNTCSVRQHAEDKIYSALGRLRPTAGEPKKLIGVLGCMAQKDGEEVLRRAPYVALVVGPGRLGRLPALLERVTAGGGPIVELSLDPAAGAGQVVSLSKAADDSAERVAEAETADNGSGQVDELPQSDRAAVVRSFVPFSPARTPPRRRPHQAMVRIMSGCNMMCSYCVVPRVRGPEQSRPVTEIVEECRQLAEQGCLEVTLIGQTVNSYKDRAGRVTANLADLLERVNQIEGLRRIKFVTNHPRHMTDQLLEAVRDLSKVSPYFHVPAQSGSDVVLRRMKRVYDAGLYREMLARIRSYVPGAAITSDFIVGFCGETDDDFQRTAELVQEARFKNSFIFKYSTRPYTAAAELYEDDVPESVKRQRNNELLAIQNAISLEDNQPFLGKTVEILVEGPSKVAKKRAVDQASRPAEREAAARGSRPSEGDGMRQLVGRTVCDRIVVFDGPAEVTGRILPVLIERVDAFTLFGRRV
ncbi:MAG: MiaB/RimO family radical SAM methylthiotransferase [Planctomycetaceae bacterium]|nr:MiaB/RimO family radical SAM methylthiotransferase [Planctomycetaceae bacterium]